MPETFEQRVAAALAKVPHTSECAVSRGILGEARVNGVLWEGTYSLGCTCDREARIAALVARAAESARWKTFNETWPREWGGGTPSPEDEAQITAYSRESFLYALEAPA